MKREKVLAEIRKVSTRLFDDKQASVYLYGSQARGDNDAQSDWDLLIITDDSLPSPSDFEKYAFPFAEIGWYLGEQITPLLYTRRQWEAEQNTLFYRNVTRDAIEI